MNGHASLNRFYRLVWSCITQGWQVVSEITRGQGKGASARSARHAVAATVASVALAGIASMAHAQQAPPAANQLPTGGVVARGAANIGQTSNAMTVNQSSQRAVINWNTFNVGQNASVTFNQPNAQAVTLNRIADQNPSQIYGQINANGQVFLSNPSGIYFSPTAQANMGALTATTHSVGDDAFMAGNLAFARNGATGAVVNEGRLNAALGGYIALLAPEVRNAGVIVAQAGTVALAAGEVITLNFNGNNGLAGITTTPSAIASLIDNRQAVQTSDGQIILSAVALNKLQAGVIRNSGSLDASSISSKGGVITLEGDDITLSSTSTINATGANGGGTVLVGGDWQGSGNLRQATKVTMAAGATIDASATQQGDGGKVVLWSDVHNADSVTHVAGSIRTVGGSQGGYGGQIETSGHYLQVAPTVSIAAGAADPSGTRGQLLLDPADVTIVDSGLGMMATLPPNKWSIFATSYSPQASINATSIDVGVIANIFSSSAMVSISTTNTGGSGAGNITIGAGVTLNIPTTKTLNLFADGGLSGSGNITLGGILSIKQSGNSTYSGTITGAGQIQKQGVGTLTLSSASSSFTGGLNFVPFNGNPGVIKVGNAGTTTTGPLGGPTNTVGTWSGSLSTMGLLDLNGIALLTPVTLQVPLTNTAGLAASFSGAVEGAGMVGISVTNDVGSDITFSGVLRGTGAAFKKYGTGTLTLSGANTYGGASNIYAGNLNVTGTLADTTALTVDSGATYTVGNTDTIGSIAGAGSIVLGSGKGLTAGAGAASGANANPSTTFSGVISGGGYFTKAGTGVLTLTGANTYTMGTTVSAGTLYVAGSLGDASSVRVNSGTTCAVSADDTIDSIAGSGSVVIGSGKTLTVNRSSQIPQMFMGVASGAGNLTVAGGSHLFFGTQTYTGTTTINSGATLSLGNASMQGQDAALASASNIVVNGTLIYDLAASTSVANAISGSGSIHNDGPGTTTLTGSVTNTGTNVVASNAGALCIGTCSSGSSSSSSSSNSVSSISSSSTPAQVQALSPSQLGSLSRGQLLALTPTQLAVLDPVQAAAVQLVMPGSAHNAAAAGARMSHQANVSGASSLGGVLPGGAPVAAPVSPAAALAPSQAANLSPAQISQLSPAQVQSIAPVQLAVMQPQQVASLTVEQLSSLSTTQVGAMSVQHIQALSPVQVSSLSVNQIQAMSADQADAVTPAQMQAMSAEKVAMVQQVRASRNARQGGVTVLCGNDATGGCSATK